MPAANLVRGTAWLSPTVWRIGSANQDRWLLMRGETETLSGKGMLLQSLLAPGAATDVSVHRIFGHGLFRLRVPA
jgi:hypothetical protein